MTSFILDYRLEGDSEFVTSLELSEVRLMKDGDLDWFILVPRRADVIEYIDLCWDDQKVLMNEINLLSRYLRQYVQPKKINIASLGNMVPQLHWHIMARFENDRAWPAPLWGTKSQKEFDLRRVDFWQKIFTEAKS